MDKRAPSPGRFDWLRRRRDFFERVAFVAFAIGFVLAMGGFIAADNARSPWPYAVIDALHGTLQLVILNVSAGETKGWALEIARVLLPASVSLALLGLVWNKLRDGILRLFVLPWRSERRVLIVGCGWIGGLMCAFYKATGARVLGVDRDPEAEHTGNFRAQRAKIVEGEAGSGDHTLSAVSAWQAGRVVICTGDDTANLEIAASVVRLAWKFRSRPPTDPDGRKKPPPPRILVCVGDKDIARAIGFDPRLAAAHKAGMVQFFAVAQTRARHLWASEAPHVLHPDRFRVREKTATGTTAAPVQAMETIRCHVAFYGPVSELEPFVLYAAQALVYDPHEALRITWFCEDADEARAAFLLRHPAFATPRPDAVARANQDPYDGQRPLVRLDFVASRPAQLDVDTLRTVHREQRIDAIYVLGHNDVQGRSMTIEALRGADFLEFDSGQAPTVVCCTHERRRADGPAETPAPPNGVSLRYFALDSWSEGARRTPFPADPVPDDRNDDLARDLKQHHNAEPWETTSDTERWFNRYAADHAAIKLTLIGALPAPAGLSVEDVRLTTQRHAAWLADLEHRRYVCERLADGWMRRLPADCEARPKLNDYRLNPTLVRAASSDLAAREADKDKVIVARLALAWERLARR